ncbi:unnamed protein product [Linum trigynum]|uniref:CCHC-type domain-containing protein n=1 Tax=Linum trigynum TaxID=586398 RepID=A0AAV2GVW9_9ROSI
MAATPSPVPPGAAPEEPKPPDPTAGVRRPPEVTSSPDGKKARESQHPKKRVRGIDLVNETVSMEEVLVEDITDEEIPETQKQEYQGTQIPSPPSQPQSQTSPVPAMAWGVGRKAVREEAWYVEDSDSEDVAEAMREDGVDDSPVEEEDPRCPTICFTKGELRSYRREWRSALGRSFPYPVIAKRLNMLWARNGPIQVTNRANGFLFVRFSQKIDYEYALTGGPWMLGDHYLTTQKWKMGFNPRTCTVSSTLVWVRLPDLPIELFNPQAVLRIAGKAGVPVRVDRATELGARGLFARACVEVDLTKPLLSKYKVEGVEYELQYEGLSNVCFECGSYGHQKSHCPTLHREGSDSPPPQAEPTHPVPHHTETYGEWMIAKRRERRPTHKQHPGTRGEQPNKKHALGQVQPSGSRFAVLDEEEGTGMSTEGEKMTTKTRHMNAVTPGSATRTGTPRQTQQVWVEKRGGSCSGETSAEVTAPNESPSAQKQMETPSPNNQLAGRTEGDKVERETDTMNIDPQNTPIAKGGEGVAPIWPGYQ